MADSLTLTIKVSTGFIDGRDNKGRYKYYYEAKILVTSSIDLVPFVIYHYVDNDGRRAGQLFINKLPKLTIATPSPKQLASYILNLRESIEEYHLRADDIALKLSRLLQKQLSNYKIEQEINSPDFAKIKLIPR